MKYKALLIDVDGTLVSVKENAMPSLKVVTALRKASKSWSIHLVTARPFTKTHNLPKIFKSLPFLSDSVINGGAQIIIPSNHNVTVTISLHSSSFSRLESLLKTCSEVVAITSVNKSFAFGKFSPSEEIIKIVAVGVNGDLVTNLMTKLSVLKNIATSVTTSYKNGSDIIITHKKATKDQAVTKLLKKYNLKKEEIIGVGDTTHDLPFLEKCGVKVAMGNAQQELKNMADFIAPSVYEDGLVAVVNKYL